MPLRELMVLLSGLDVMSYKCSLEYQSYAFSSSCVIVLPRLQGTASAPNGLTCQAFDLHLALPNSLLGALQSLMTGRALEGHYNAV